MRLLLPLVAVAGALVGGAAYDTGHSRSVDPAYLTAPVERGSIKTTVTATGTVKAVVTVEVGSQLSGQIGKLFVDFNDTVHRDQPIAQLDQSVYLAKVREAEAALETAKTSVAVADAAVERTRSNLTTAQAQVRVLDAKTALAASTLAAAQRDFDRTTSLAGKGVASDRQLDQARATRDAAVSGQREAEAQNSVHVQEIKTAAADLKKTEAELANAQAVVAQKEAELAQARVELERTVILSPIDGVVIGRKVDRGQTVAASLKAPTLFTIAQDLREMDVHAKVDEADIGRIKVGQTATFTVDAFPRRRFEATVKQIRRAPETEKNVVTYTVVLAASNPDLLLLPGMTALVDIVVDEAPDVLKVPNAALRFHPPAGHRSNDTVAALSAADGDRSATVWVLDRDGLPQSIPVRLGAGNPTTTAVLAGELRDGQRVIVGTAQAPNSRGPLGFRLGF